MQIVIKFLADHLEFIPQLAELQYQEITRHWVPDGSVERAKQKLLEHANCDRLPLSLVVLESNHPIGMASLRLTDGIQPGVSPWLGSLVVDPKYRNQQVGQKLIEAIKQQARLFNYTELYLLAFDPTISNWYATLGWKDIGSDKLFGHNVTVMSIDL